MADARKLTNVEQLKAASISAEQKRETGKPFDYQISGQYNRDAFHDWFQILEKHFAALETSHKAPYVAVSNPFYPDTYTQKFFDFAQGLADAKQQDTYTLTRESLDEVHSYALKLKTQPFTQRPTGTKLAPRKVKLLDTYQKFFLMAKSLDMLSELEASFSSQKFTKAFDAIDQNRHLYFDQKDEKRVQLQTATMISGTSHYAKALKGEKSFDAQLTYLEQQATHLKTQKAVLQQSRLALTLPITLDPEKLRLIKQQISSLAAQVNNETNPENIPNLTAEKERLAGEMKALQANLDAKQLERKTDFANQPHKELDFVELTKELNRLHLELGLEFPSYVRKFDEREQDLCKQIPPIKRYLAHLTQLESLPKTWKDLNVAQIRTMIDGQGGKKKEWGALRDHLIRLHTDFFSGKCDVLLVVMDPLMTPDTKALQARSNQRGGIPILIKHGDEYLLFGIARNTARYEFAPLGKREWDFLPDVHEDQNIEITLSYNPDNMPLYEAMTQAGIVGLSSRIHFLRSQLNAQNLSLKNREETTTATIQADTQTLKKVVKDYQARSTALQRAINLLPLIDSDIAATAPVIYKQASVSDPTKQLQELSQKLEAVVISEDEITNRQQQAMKQASLVDQEVDTEKAALLASDVDDSAAPQPAAEVTLKMQSSTPAPTADVKHASREIGTADPDAASASGGKPTHTRYSSSMPSTLHQSLLDRSRAVPVKAAPSVEHEASAPSSREHSVAASPAHSPSLVRPPVTPQETGFFARLSNWWNTKVPAPIRFIAKYILLPAAIAALIYFTGGVAAIPLGIGHALTSYGTTTGFFITMGAAEAVPVTHTVIDYCRSRSAQPAAVSSADPVPAQAQQRAATQVRGGDTAAISRAAGLTIAPSQHRSTAAVAIPNSGARNSNSPSHTGAMTVPAHNRYAFAGSVTQRPSHSFLDLLNDAQPTMPPQAAARTITAPRLRSNGNNSD